MTSQGGAPAAVNGGWYMSTLNQMGHDSGAFVFMSGLFGDILNSNEDESEWIDISAETVLAASAGGAINTVVNSVAGQYLNGQASLTDLAPGSAFLSALNSTNNLQREAGIPYRYGLNSQLSAGYLGGPFRLLPISPTDADYAGWSIINLGYYLLASAEDHHFNLAPSDPYYFEEVYGLSAEADLGSLLTEWPALWCVATSNSPYCPASDGIVPVSAQIYPGAVSNDGIVGPSHVEETTDAGVINHLQLRIANADAASAAPQLAGRSSGNAIQTGARLLP